jgi:hypothetical protein
VLSNVNPDGNPVTVFVTALPLLSCVAILIGDIGEKTSEVSTDQANNKSTTTFTINVVDTTAPTVTPIGDKSSCYCITTIVLRSNFNR